MISYIMDEGMKENKGVWLSNKEANILLEDLKDMERKFNQKKLEIELRRFS
jgi:hypothetical protein